MLDLLQETLLYIEQQHDWLAYIQSVISENEQKYKLLHSNITCKITEEMAHHNTSYNENKIHEVVVKDEFIHNDDDFGDNLKYEEASETLFEIQSNHETQQIQLLNEFCTRQLSAGSALLVQHRNVNDTPPISSASENSNNIVPPSSTIQNFDTGEAVETTSQNLSIQPHSSFPKTIHLTEKNVLKKHVPLFKCELCLKIYKSKTSLNYHMKTHTGEKPFKCLYCYKSFPIKPSLTKHVRTHTGERPYECFVCNKSFGRKETLNQHFRRHTGEKPFKCSICGASFKSRSSVTRHSRRHTQAEVSN